MLICMYINYLVYNTIRECNNVYECELSHVGLLLFSLGSVGWSNARLLSALV